MDVENVEKSSYFWVFGYGSLCWNPGFKYQKAVTGYVKGFSRRFWQGNTTHRGTEIKPGRVATLIEDKDMSRNVTLGQSLSTWWNVAMEAREQMYKKQEHNGVCKVKTKGITWGRAFLVSSQETAALPYLSKRECQLGGYKEYLVNFHPRPDLYASTSTIPVAAKKEAFLYIATPENRHWLGTAPLTDIAKQILECEGPSGSNVEYLLRLADFMRQEVPEALDEHLFSLERLVRIFAVEMKVCLRSLMGDEKEESPKPEPRPTSYQYASRVPEKKLRCVNM